MNTNESNFILYSYRENILIPSIKLYDNFIIQTNSLKFLGITIDKHLGEHINNISSKISPQYFLKGALYNDTCLILLFLLIS